MEYYIMRLAVQLKLIYKLLDGCECPEAAEARRVLLANIRVLELLIETEFKP